MAQEARREPRYRVTDPEKIVALLKTDDQKKKVQILDFSQSGLRLRVNEPVGKGARIELEISSDAMEVEIRLEADVCWVEADRGGWLIGCVIQPKLEQSTLNELAMCGALERRRDNRRTLSFLAEAKTKLSSEFQDIHVVNISAGGFCASADACFVNAQDRLLVRITNDTKGESQLIQVRVAWVQDNEQGGQTVGCNFLTKSDFAKLQAVAEEHRVGNPLFRRMMTRTHGTRWSIVATGLMLVILVVQQIYIVQRLVR